MLPIFCSAQAITGKYDPKRKVASYIAVLHIGITTPIVLTTLVNAYLSFALGKLEVPSDNFTKREAKKSDAFKKLINGLVVWLIICNAPYIAWYHYSLNCFNNKEIKMPWIGIEGVWYKNISKTITYIASYDLFISKIKINSIPFCFSCCLL